VTSRERLDQQAAALATRLTDELVEGSEQVEYRMGTYLLAALVAELAQRIEARCWEQARRTPGHWERAAAEADTLVASAWRCIETVSLLSNHFEAEPER
jgi:hypothetical protein